MVLTLWISSFRKPFVFDASIIGIFRFNVELRYYLDDACFFVRMCGVRVGGEGVVLLFNPTKRLVDKLTSIFRSLQLNL